LCHTSIRNGSTTDHLLSTAAQAWRPHSLSEVKRIQAPKE
jgi:hypothetical protein